MSLIAELLPGSVAVVTAESGDELRPLLPGEGGLVADAVPSRRAEFTAGRTCARAALRRLGLPEQAILADDRRAPLWPTGVVGSITHCAGFTAAAVAWRRDIATLGIDTEPLGELDDADAAIVATTAERQRASDQLGTDAGRLLFSAKESIYKAWHQLTRRWLEFHDVTVSVTRGGTFTVVPGQHLDVADHAVLSTLRGRFAFGTEHVFTAVHMPNEAAWGDD